MISFENVFPSSVPINMPSFVGVAFLVTSRNLVVICLRVVLLNLERSVKSSPRTRRECRTSQGVYAHTLQDFARNADWLIRHRLFWSEVCQRMEDIYTYTAQRERYRNGLDLRITTMLMVRETIFCVNGHLCRDIYIEEKLDS
jgi:hypothetical protein